MNEVFRQHVEALHPKLEMLMAMKPESFTTLAEVSASR
jgi:hypothetical protein